MCAFAQVCEHVLSVHASRQVFSALQSAFAVHAFAADAHASSDAEAAAKTHPSRTRSRAGTGEP